MLCEAYIKVILSSEGTFFGGRLKESAGGTEDGADAGQGGVAEGNQRRTGVEGEVREGVCRGEGAAPAEVRSGSKGKGAGRGSTVVR